MAIAESRQEKAAVSANQTLVRNVDMVMVGGSLGRTGRSALRCTVCCVPGSHFTIHSPEVSRYRQEVAAPMQAEDYEVMAPNITAKEKDAHKCALWLEKMWAVFALVNSLLISTSIVPFTKDNLHPVTFVLWAITITWNALTLLITLFLYGTMLAQHTVPEDVAAKASSKAEAARQSSKADASVKDMAVEAPYKSAGNEDSNQGSNDYLLHMTWLAHLPMVGTLGGALTFVASILSYVFTDTILHSDDPEELPRSEDRAAIDGVFWAMIAMVAFYVLVPVFTALECRLRILKSWLERKVSSH